jgi:hypothetical protein
VQAAKTLEKLAETKFVLQKLFQLTTLRNFFQKTFCCSFVSPDASSSSWTQTLDFDMMRQVFYHCATILGACNIKLITAVVNSKP